ncbi:hypothetical protein Pelo_5779 [Pelomyxa schiedti]|nr:hypothetical protein Pelo_5779 [Pelomyxa schiedti]
MASLITLALRKYMRVFLKNFSDRQLSTQVFKGEITMRNIELNEKVLQVLLKPIPPHLEIKSVSCGGLRIKIPWRHLKSEPVQVSLSDVRCIICEAVEVTPLPEIPALQKLFKKNKEPKSEEPDPKKKKDKKHSFVDSIIENLQISVVGVHVAATLLAGPPSPSVTHHPTTTFILDLEGFSVSSTNGRWEVIDSLSLMNELNRGKAAVTLYKQARINPITVSLQPPNSPPVQLLRTPPIAINVTLQRSALNKKIIDLHIDTNISKLCLTWTLDSWGSTISYIESLLSTFKREVPKTDSAKPPTPPPTVMDTADELPDGDLDDSLDAMELMEEEEKSDSAAAITEPESQVPIYRFNFSLSEFSVLWGDIAIVLGGLSVSSTTERFPAPSPPEREAEVAEKQLMMMQTLFRTTLSTLTISLQKHPTTGATETALWVGPLFGPTDPTSTLPVFDFTFVSRATPDWTPKGILVVVNNDEILCEVQPLRVVFDISSIMIVLEFFTAKLPSLPKKNKSLAPTSPTTTPTLPTTPPNVTSSPTVSSGISSPTLPPSTVTKTKQPKKRTLKCRLQIKEIVLMLPEHRPTGGHNKVEKVIAQAIAHPAVKSSTKTVGKTVANIAAQGTTVSPDINYICARLGPITLQCPPPGRTSKG